MTASRSPALRPLDIVIFGLSLFALSLGTIGMVWVERYRDLAGSFV